MTKTSLSKSSHADLPQALATAQTAMHFPEVQEMKRRPATSRAALVATSNTRWSEQTSRVLRSQQRTLSSDMAKEVL